MNVKNRKWRIIIVSLLAAVIIFSSCSCNFLPGGSNNTSDAHEKLIKEAEELMATAEKQYDVGLTFQSEYVYGLAQAEISSLRLCIDTLLWLKGEGTNLAEVIGDAPYKNWNEIVGAGLGSDAPFYFEGLLYRFQGETEKAEECFTQASYNPLHEERDFYYLRKMSVDELYSLKNKVVEVENKLYEKYTPRTFLLSDRTGAEFSPAYHLAMAQDMSDNTEAVKQCGINALLSSPVTPSLYGYAASYCLNAGDVQLAVDILNEGLFLAPDDATINYVAALYSSAAGDNNSAKAYLDTAKANAEGDLLARINELYSRIGG